MWNSHLFKILAIFVMILGLGLVSFTLVSNYEKNGGNQATPARP